MWGSGLIVAIALVASVAVAADPVKKAFRRERLTPCDKRMVVAAFAITAAGIALALAGRRIESTMEGGCYNSHTSYIRPVSYKWPDPPAPQRFIGGSDAPAPYVPYVPYVPPPGLDVPSGGGTLPAPIELPPYVPPPAAAARPPSTPSAGSPKPTTPRTPRTPR